MPLSQRLSKVKFSTPTNESPYVPAILEETINGIIETAPDEGVYKTLLTRKFDTISMKNYENPMAVFA
jgi:hypothetical protein